MYAFMNHRLEAWDKFGCKNRKQGEDSEQFEWQGTREKTTDGEKADTHLMLKGLVDRVFVFFFFKLPPSDISYCCFERSKTTGSQEYVLCFTLLFTTVLSQRDFSHGKFGLLPPPPSKASKDRVALPNLQSILGVSLFP